MQVPIPDDWDGDWLCVQIEWPDSPQYLGLLMGFLTQMTRGRFWNENTGSVIGAQQIGWQVHDRNIPLVDCASEPIQPEPEIVYEYITLGDCEGEDCEDCMGCSIPYGALRINRTTGALEYLYCGEWYEVTDWEYAALGDQPSQPDPGDLDPPDPPPDDIACQKAFWIGGEFTRFMKSCYDQFSLTKLVFSWSNDVRNDMDGYSLSNWSMYKMFQVTQVVWAADALFEDVFGEIDQTQLICQFAYLLNSTDYTLSREEFDAMRSIVSGWAGSVALKAFMATAFDVLNFSNFQKMAADALGIEVYDCECGEIVPPPDYLGEVKFTGAVTAATNMTWIRNVHTLNNGKILEFDWCPPATDSKEDGTLAFGITTPTPVNSLDIKQSPREGTDMPTREWQVDPCETLNPALWAYTDFGGTWNETAVDVITGATPSVTWHCVPDTPPASKTSFEWNPRKCPALGGGAKVYKVRLEIVRVDGVDV